MGVAMLKRFGETPYVAPRDRGPDLDKAIEGGGLVLVDSRREVYWKTKLLVIDWFKQKQPWSFLFQLANKAQRNSYLDALTFLGENHHNPKAIGGVKLRLVKLKGIPRRFEGSDRILGKQAIQAEAPAWRNSRLLSRTPRGRSPSRMRASKSCSHLQPIAIRT